MIPFREVEEFFIRMTGGKKIDVLEQVSTHLSAYHFNYIKISGFMGPNITSICAHLSAENIILIISTLSRCREEVEQLKDLGFSCTNLSSIFSTSPASLSYSLKAMVEPENYAILRALLGDRRTKFTIAGREVGGMGFSTQNVSSLLHATRGYLIEVLTSLSTQDCWEAFQAFVAPNTSLVPLRGEQVIGAGMTRSTLTAILSHAKREVPRLLLELSKPDNMEDIKFLTSPRSKVITYEGREIFGLGHSGSVLEGHLIIKLKDINGALKCLIQHSLRNPQERLPTKKLLATKKLIDKNRSAQEQSSKENNSSPKNPSFERETLPQPSTSFERERPAKTQTQSQEKDVIDTQGKLRAESNIPTATEALQRLSRISTTAPFTQSQAPFQEPYQTSSQAFFDQPQVPTQMSFQEPYQISPQEFFDQPQVLTQEFSQIPSRATLPQSSYAQSQTLLQESYRDLLNEPLAPSQFLPLDSFQGAYKSLPQTPVQTPPQTLSRMPFNLSSQEYFKTPLQVSPHVLPPLQPAEESEQAPSRMPFELSSQEYSQEPLQVPPRVPAQISFKTPFQTLSQSLEVPNSERFQISEKEALESLPSINISQITQDLIPDEEEFKEFFTTFLPCEYDSLRCIRRKTLNTDFQTLKQLGFTAYHLSNITSSRDQKILIDAIKEIACKKNEVEKVLKIGFTHGDVLSLSYNPKEMGRLLVTLSLPENNDSLTRLLTSLGMEITKEGIEGRGLGFTHSQISSLLRSAGDKANSILKKLFLKDNSDCVNAIFCARVTRVTIGGYPIHGMGIRPSNFATLLRFPRGDIESLVDLFLTPASLAKISFLTTAEHRATVSFGQKSKGLAIPVREFLILLANSRTSMYETLTELIKDENWENTKSLFTSKTAYAAGEEDKLRLGIKSSEFGDFMHAVGVNGSQALKCILSPDTWDRFAQLLSSSKPKNQLTKGESGGGMGLTLRHLIEMSPSYNPNFITFLEMLVSDENWERVNVLMRPIGQTVIVQGKEVDTLGLTPDLLSTMLSKSGNEISKAFASLISEENWSNVYALLSPAGKNIYTKEGLVIGLGLTPKLMTRTLSGSDKNINQFLLELISPKNWIRVVSLFTPAGVKKIIQNKEIVGLGFNPNHLASIMGGHIRGAGLALSHLLSSEHWTRTHALFSPTNQFITYNGEPLRCLGFTSKNMMDIFADSYANLAAGILYFISASHWENLAILVAPDLDTLPFSSTGPKGLGFNAQVISHHMSFLSDQINKSLDKLFCELSFYRKNGKLNTEEASRTITTLLHSCLGLQKKPSTTINGVTIQPSTNEITATLREKAQSNIIVQKSILSYAERLPRSTASNFQPCISNTYTGVSAGADILTDNDITVNQPTTNASIEAPNPVIDDFKPYISNAYTSINADYNICTENDISIYNQPTANTLNEANPIVRIKEEVYSPIIRPIIDDTYTGETAGSAIRIKEEIYSPIVGNSCAGEVSDSSIHIKEEIYSPIMRPIVDDTYTGEATGSAIYVKEETQPTVPYTVSNAYMDESFECTTYPTEGNQEAGLTPSIYNSFAKDVPGSSYTEEMVTSDFSAREEARPSSNRRYALNNAYRVEGANNHDMSILDRPELPQIQLSENELSTNGRGRFFESGTWGETQLPFTTTFAQPQNLMSNVGNQERGYFANTQDNSTSNFSPQGFMRQAPSSRIGDIATAKQNINLLGKRTAPPSTIFSRDEILRAKLNHPEQPSNPFLS